MCKPADMSNYFFPKLLELYAHDFLAMAIGHFHSKEGFLLKISTQRPTSVLFHITNLWLVTINMCCRQTWHIDECLIGWEEAGSAVWTSIYDSIARTFDAGHQQYFSDGCYSFMFRCCGVVRTAPLVELMLFLQCTFIWHRLETIEADNLTTAISSTDPALDPAQILSIVLWVYKVKAKPDLDSAPPLTVKEVETRLINKHMKKFFWNCICL